MLANDIPTTFLTCNMQRKRVWEQTTPQHRSFTTHMYSAQIIYYTYVLSTDHYTTHMYYTIYLYSTYLQWKQTVK